jgi:hypothetical protein
VSLALALICCAPLARGDDTPSATPYRPGAANPAELSAPGWLEGEAGIARSNNGGASFLNDTSWLLKLAFSEDFGVMLGGDARLRQSDPGGVLSGRGDTSLTFKNRWAVDDATAFGLEWGAKFPTADDGLGSGKRDYGFNSIVSRDIGQVRIDANVGATRLGLIEPGLARWQYPWAVALSRPVSEDWSMAIEESGVVRHGAATSTQFMIAASCNVTKRLVLDAGMISGISNAAPRWSAFMGVTWLAARLW